MVLSEFSSVRGPTIPTGDGHVQESIIPRALAGVEKPPAGYRSFRLARSLIGTASSAGRQ